jgi:endonuclease-3 related protein
MVDAALSIAHALRDLYRRLYHHFGYSSPWWPGSPLEITLTAILVQRCNWSVAWRAVGRLREDELLSLRRLAAAGPQQVQDCITGVAFASRKAGQLIQLAKDVLTRGHETVEELLSPSRGTERVREDLLSMHGVGWETADASLLFASEHPVFVVDAYTRRIFRRLRAVPGLEDRFWDRPYRELRQFFETYILGEIDSYEEFPLGGGVPRSVALLRDWHAQLVELGKHHCLVVPRCLEQGKPCWRDFDVGQHHCLPSACRCCPLNGTCSFAEALRIHLRQVTVK